MFYADPPNTPREKRAQQAAARAYGRHYRAFYQYKRFWLVVVGIAFLYLKGSGLI
jgi:hypothetical protein